MPGRASFNYDVFLSFRGEDTRYNFTGNLYNALNQRGIHTFFDDKEIRKGEEITQKLLKSIEESRISIVVLSKHYAFSSFCLKELTAILECYEKNKTNRLFLPVFYDVDPSDVRHCRGSFAEGMAKQEERFKNDMELVDKWRTSLHKAALEKTAEIAGYTFKIGDGYEYLLIERILKEVSQKINRRLLHVANYPVGLKSRMDKVKSHLNLGSDDVVHMIGIWGTGGIGKSTIARAVYNSISDQFDGFCCFLENVRENSEKYGLVHLQERVLSEIFRDEITLGNLSNGKSTMESRLCGKKVLLVLDDVDQTGQLQAIVGEPNWLCLGSRVIITTRNSGLLRKHNVNITYDVEELSENEARQLLTWNAFKVDKADTRYTTILDRAMGYASRLPLALEVIGSNLFKKGEEECMRTLDQYDKHTDKEIDDILKVSYVSLDEDEKKVFLDIACCFEGCKLSDVENILHAHHGSPMRLSIESLIEKSLIKIDDYLVTLHQLIRDMGRDIVRQESQEPAERSRLWFWEEVVQVLEQKKGTSNIHILILDFPKDEAHLQGPNGEVVNWDGEAFKKMDKLKTLIIRNGHFSTGPTHLPDSLRVLKWQGYHSPSLPCYFYPMKLSVLELPDSHLESCEPIQAFTNLRILNLSNSESITHIPDVSRVENLETLSFRDCVNLTEIDESVGRLGHLKILDASGCKNLKTFPPIILTSLEQLNLSHCSILERFPEILGKMEQITELRITGSFIKRYPFSIQKLARLQKLKLQMCGMVQLPSSIFMLPELSLMHISECQGLVLSEEDKSKEMASKSSNVDHLVLSDCNISTDFLPKGLTHFSNVKDLNLSKNNFTTLHAWIKDCHFLRNLTLDDCNQLQEIKGIPRKLEKLSLKGCKFLRCLDLAVLPDCTAECCSLKELILDDCRCLLEIKGLPKNLDNFSAKSCTSLTSHSMNMLFNKVTHKISLQFFKNLPLHS
ncbi:TMV resistance protein N isoform X2 [Medicago truncatula]|uniref:TMV resistance protein N isoform X2 n=1 Tax=Medicago truncatula TaxID=3880 RepID=UPI000D2F2448|nr:TMV resistance protein N isoform X2 [Medicago truncatula]